MSDAYISQVMAFGFGFAPRNWALCNGQILSIAQNTALFSLLGTNYGGNGSVTFGLPNLQSRVPLHPDGSNYMLGEMGGEENVTLTSEMMPFHSHGFFGTSETADSPQPVDGAALAKVGAISPNKADNYYAPDATFVSLNPSSISLIGGGQPHANIQPYLTINWCICTAGIYPARN